MLRRFPAVMSTHQYRQPIRTQLNALIQQGDSFRKGVPEFGGASEEQIQEQLTRHGGHAFKPAFAWSEQVVQVLRLDAPDFTHAFDAQAVPELTYPALREYLTERVQELRTIMDKLPSA